MWLFYLKFNLIYSMYNFLVLINFNYLIISATIIINNNNKCDLSGILLYEDMGCKPIYSSENTNNLLCASSYECLGLKKSTKNCYLKGKTYQINEMVDSKLTQNLCDLGCSCQKKNHNMTNFKCATVSCPEWSIEKPPTGCYRKYSLNDCCYIREMCPPYENSTTCIYDGKLYKEGENFLPKNTCWRCVCQAGFRGKLEKPFCRRRSCGVQVKMQEKLQQRCAPLYYKHIYKENEPLCCPTSWICSDGTEKVLGHAHTQKSTAKMCVFGEKLLKIGQKIEKNVEIPRNLTVTCECKIPPLLTCIKNVI